MVDKRRVLTLSTVAPERPLAITIDGIDFAMAGKDDLNLISIAKFQQWADRAAEMEAEGTEELTGAKLQEYMSLAHSMVSFILPDIESEKSDILTKLSLLQMLEIIQVFAEAVQEMTPELVPQNRKQRRSRKPTTAK